MTASVVVDRLLAEHGWAVIDLPDRSPIMVARARLLQRLREHALADLTSLDEYHRFVDDTERHVAILHDLAAFFWAEQIGQSIITANLDLFRQLLGPDLHIQRYPYFRIVRPGVVPDAAPLHRDTYYGASPYELSIVVPFTEMDENSALRVVDGSHVAADAEYPFTQTISDNVAFKSVRHELGFAYAPRVLDPAAGEKTIAVPLAVGQALIFGLSLIHGAGVNVGARTRFSTDIRLVHSLAPVAWSRGVRSDYYVPLCRSAIVDSARQYADANRQPSQVVDPSIP